jgi:hypothetical protein
MTQKTKDRIFSIQAVDAHCLFHALERLRHSTMCHGISSVELIEEKPPDPDEVYCAVTRAEDYPALLKTTPGHLIFTAERYAMDGLGSHVGYEKFTASLTLYPFVSGTRHHAATPESNWYVIPESLEVEEIIPAADTPTYKPLAAHAFLKEMDEPNSILADQLEGWDRLNAEQKLDLAFDLGLGEGDYTPPDDDFAYQELDHILNQALEDLPFGSFSWAEEGRVWTIQFDDGEVVWSYNLDDPYQERELTDTVP